MRDAQPAVRGGGPVPPRRRRSRRAPRRWPVPESTNWRASADSTIRSAHIPPHQSRVSGVAKHHRPPVGVTSSNPARCAQDSSRRPASGSPPLARAAAEYSAIQRSSARKLREPGEPRVVGVTGGDDAARLAHPPHLAQRLHRVGHVLQHLVGVHDVEGVVGKIQRVDVRRSRSRCSTGRASAPRRAPNPKHQRSIRRR